jgi:hypothetical protein
MGRAVVISEASKAIVVLVQASPTWPHLLLATKELKAMYTLGEVKVNPSALALVLGWPGAGVVGVAWSGQK